MSLKAEGFSVCLLNDVLATVPLEQRETVQRAVRIQLTKNCFLFWCLCDGHVIVNKNSFIHIFLEKYSLKLNYWVN